MPHAQSTRNIDDIDNTATISIKKHTSAENLYDGLMSNRMYLLFSRNNFFVKSKLISSDHFVTA